MECVCFDFFLVWGKTQDLSTLFSTQEKTFLPPVVALYALCNALLVNGPIPIALFMSMVEENGTTIRVLPAFLSIFLRVVRDMVACFTMCIIEGIYWADVSLKKHVEDQPFPLSFMPTERVFGKDDCEGRATQVQHMKHLFIQIWKCVEYMGHANFLELIMGMCSTQVCLHMSKTEISQLLECCCLVGRLFNQGGGCILEVETTVGDVHFGSLRDGVQAEVVGHSFAMVLYRNTTTTTAPPQQDVCIIETTGWERRYLPEWDKSINAAEKDLITHIPSIFEQYTGKKNNVNVCGIISGEIESQIYQDILLGHDSIYFTLAPPSSLTKKKKPPCFGTHVNAIRKSLTYYYHNKTNLCKKKEHSDNTHNRIITGSFRLSTRDFIQELCATTSTSKLPRMWPVVEGAEDILCELDHVQVLKVTLCNFFF